jgi:hypothetical protein
MTPAQACMHAAAAFRKQYGEDSVLGAYADDAEAACDELVDAANAEREAREVAEIKKNRPAWSEWRKARDRLRAAIIGMGARP